MRSRWVLDIRDGKVANVFEGPSLDGSGHSRFQAPAREWERIATGKTDWYPSHELPGLGELTLSGNAVAAMRNVKAMYRLLEGVKTAGTVRGRSGGWGVLAGAQTQRAKRPIGRYMTVNGIRVLLRRSWGRAADLLHPR